MEQNLDDILNGTPVVEQTAEAPAQEAPAESVEAAPETPDRPRDEQGRFLPKSEAEPAVEAVPEAAPPAAEDESPTVPRTALLDERKKRQTLESQLAEANARIQAQLPPPAQQQPQAKPDQWDDPDGYERWLADQAGGIAEQRAVAAVQDHLIRVSAEAAKKAHPDYMDKVAVFEQLSTQNPALLTQMRQHPNPAEFAYETAVQHERVSQYGSLDELLAAEKVKWEADALERLKATLPAQSAPPTLSGERNVGQRSGPEWSGAKPLSEILQ